MPSEREGRNLLRLLPYARSTHMASGLVLDAARRAKYPRRLGAWRPNTGGLRSCVTVGLRTASAYPTRRKSRSRHLAAVRFVTARAYRARQEASIFVSSTRFGSNSASILSSTRVTVSDTPVIASR